jgi:hypothetical protein
MEEICISCGKTSDLNSVEFLIGPRKVTLFFCQSCSGNPRQLNAECASGILKSWGWKEDDIDTVSALIRSIVRKSNLRSVA